MWACVCVHVYVCMCRGPAVEKACGWAVQHNCYGNHATPAPGTALELGHSKHQRHGISWLHPGGAWLIVTHMGSLYCKGCAAQNLIDLIDLGAAKELESSAFAGSKTQTLRSTLHTGALPAAACAHTLLHHHLQQPLKHVSSPPLPSHCAAHTLLNIPSKPPWNLEWKCCAS